MRNGRGLGGLTPFNPKRSVWPGSRANASSEPHLTKTDPHPAIHASFFIAHPTYRIGSYLYVGSRFVPDLLRPSHFAVNWLSRLNEKGRALWTPHIS